MFNLIAFVALLFAPYASYRMFSEGNDRGGWITIALFLLGVLIISYSYWRFSQEKTDMDE